MRLALIFSAVDLPQLDTTCVGAANVRRIVTRDTDSAFSKSREYRPRLTIVDAAAAGATSLIRHLRFDSRTCDTGIAALSASPDLADEGELREAGANLVLARSADPGHWDGPLRRLLEVPPRRASRMPATFDVWEGSRASSRRRAGVVLNISLHGMLLEMRRSLPIGTKIDAVVSLPDGSVHVLAEVVRDAGSDGRRCRAGVQFLVLRGEAASRIACFVNDSLIADEAGASHGEPRRSLNAPGPPEAAQWEAELRASEARLRGVLDSSLDAVVLFDHHGQARELNRAAETMFGCSREDVLGRPAIDRLVPEPLRQIFRRALAQRHVAAEHVLGRRIEVELRRADDLPFTAELTFTRFATRGSGFWVLFARDVTERRRLTDELQANQRRFRALVENSADGIALLERDGRFRYLTQSAAAMWGYEPAELIGHTFDEVVVSECVGEARQILKRSRDWPGVPIPGEVRCRHRDGSFRVIEGVVVNHLDTPEVGALVVNYRDVTHRHRAQQLEEELRQSQKIEALGRLAGGIAHDFNNLMGVILGASRLAATEPGDPTRRLDQIQRAAEKAAALTQQLLAFSRKQVLTPEVLDVGAILLDLNTMLEPLIGERIVMSAVVAPDLARVRADRSQLEQAIMNLVVNARDAMPHGGRLTVEARNVELDADFVAAHVGSRRGAFVQLSVTDTGAGMDMETQRRVFEPFFTTKEKEKGTGLGLATTYGIVKQSGGYISVRSVVGGGSRFDIFLPRADGLPARKPAPAHVVASARPGETILLVEDDPMLRRVAVEILEAAGYPVLEAASGEQAVDLCRSHHGPVPLLVTDVVMPGMSGRQVAESLHDARPEMRVLYITGHTGEEILRHGIVQGKVDLLLKPFAPEVLAAAVRRVLDHGRSEDAAAMN